MLPRIVDIIKDLRAYYELIELYKMDSLFTLLEEEQFSGVLLKHLHTIKDDSPEFAGLAFEIGKLYWYYYAYGQDAGENQFTRIAHAAPWFGDAANIAGFERWQEAQVYSDVASFELSITARIYEGADAGAYLPFYDALMLLQEMAAFEQNDVVSLRGVALSFKALESYPRKFKVDGLSQTELLALFDASRALLSKVHPASDFLDELKDELLQKEDEVRQGILDAFSG